MASHDNANVTAKVLTALAWAKRAQEAADADLEIAQMRAALRRANKAAGVALADASEFGYLERRAPVPYVRVLRLVVSILYDCCARTRAAAKFAALRGEVDLLEAAIDELDNLAENQEIAVEAGALYDETARRLRAAGE
jgi:hypothetical protein